MARPWHTARQRPGKLWRRHAELQALPQERRLFAAAPCQPPAGDQGANALEAVKPGDTGGAAHATLFHLRGPRYNGVAVFHCPGPQ
jgi:hypothetical protein